MNYRCFPPPPELADHVRFFWVLEGEASAATPYVYRSLADGCVELVFHLRSRFDELCADGRREASFTGGMHGPSRHFRRFEVSDSFEIFGVYLYPFAVPALLSVSCAELSDQMPDLYSLFGHEGRTLEQRVAEAPDHARRIALVSAFLKQHLRPRKNFSHDSARFIRQLIHTQAAPDVHTMAERHFLSVRQFERRFRDLSGFSPKLYARILRFHAALDRYPQKHRPLTEIALECGYYDQSHFIHDFKAFSGHHPKTYFSGKAEGAEYRDF